MGNDREVMLLDRFIDQLNTRSRADTVSLPLGSSVELIAFFEIARKLKRYLAPVEPSPIFREALHATLVTAAARTAPEPTSWPVQYKKEIMIGAAVGSALSLAGVVAIVLRGRMEGRRAA
jgi:hypothetical protein